MPNALLLGSQKWRGTRNILSQLIYSRIRPYAAVCLFRVYLVLNAPVFVKYMFDFSFLRNCWFWNFIHRVVSYHDLVSFCISPADYWESSPVKRIRCRSSRKNRCQTHEIAVAYSRCVGFSLITTSVLLLVAGMAFCQVLDLF